MKGFFILFVALAVQTLHAQPTNNQPANFEQALATEAARLSTEVTPVFQLAKPQTIEGSRMTLDGLFVDLLRVDNPLQLFNPLAGLEYGSAEDRIVRDIITFKITGLKLFSVRF
jgi:hypothetical protein